MPSTVADSRSKTSGRFFRLRPQFSLRTLLVVVTVFGIGFPVWYRWPVREVKLKYPRDWKMVGGQNVEVEDKSAEPVRTVTTWQRRWGKGWVKHGPTTVTYKSKRGLQVTILPYENGELQGTYSHTADGTYEKTGRYERGKREGMWTISYSERGEKATVRWHDNRVHGPAEYWAADGTITKSEFDGGRITNLNGQSVSSPLLNRIERGEIRYPQLAEELERENCCAFAPMPLVKWWGYMREAHYVPLLISPKVSDRSVEIGTKECFGINLQAALVITAQKSRLECDYRYGCLWITTPEDAKDWRDPTGVDEIRPPVGSVLSAAWNEPALVWHCDQSLAKVVALICEPKGVAFDVTQVSAKPGEPARFPVKVYMNINLEYRSFRDVLGVMLYLTGCRCKLAGKKLVILPPDENAPTVD